MGVSHSEWNKPIQVATQCRKQEALMLFNTIRADSKNCKAMSKEKRNNGQEYELIHIQKSAEP